MHVFFALILHNDDDFHDFQLGEIKLPKYSNILLWLFVNSTQLME